MENSINNTAGQSMKKITFPYKGGIHLLSPDQIIRLEADSNYTYIFTIDRKPILMAKVIREYEDLLRPFGFLRTHRSHLINIAHITNVTECGTIMMDDQSIAEISRRKRKEILATIKYSFQAA